MKIRSTTWSWTSDLTIGRGAPVVRSRRGFSLVELIVAITVVIVLSAAAIPSLRGVMAEQRAREPIAELLRLAKEARLRAMKERRPYQVAITAQGFTASRYFDPYLNFTELTTFLSTIDAAEEAGIPMNPEDPVSSLPDPSSAGNVNEATAGSTGVPPPPKPEWNERYTLPEGTRLATQYWHESVPTPVEGELVKLWVFQPTGMCEPLKLSLTREGASFEIEFSALTADIVRERSDIK